MRFIRALLSLLLFSAVAHAAPLKISSCDLTTPHAGDLSQILKICATTCHFELATPTTKMSLILECYARGDTKPQAIASLGIDPQRAVKEGDISIQIADLAHLPLAGGKSTETLISSLFSYGNLRTGKEAKVDKKNFDTSNGIGGSKFPTGVVYSNGKAPLFYILGSPTSGQFVSAPTVEELIKANPTATILVVSLQSLM